MGGRTRWVGRAVAVLAMLAPAHSAAAAAPGHVVSSSPLAKRLWLPGSTAKAFKLKYDTTGPTGKPARSTGTVFLPKGKEPRGGWPVVSWAHGTSGLADKCAPSRVGPALPERDRPYLARWMNQGYAIVASDYTGLGTAGLHPYLDGRTSAHSIVDMVTAGRNLARRRGSFRLARSWVVIGQSQGGGAAIYTARHATAFGGPGLDYRGAVGTGTPAYTDRILGLVGPGIPSAVSAGLTAYITYLVAALRYVHPELGIDGILTDAGRRYLALAERQCVFEFEDTLAGVSFGTFFTQPLATLPGWPAVARDYLHMPEKGFDRPFFMGHGLTDVDVPIAITLPYVAELEANGEPLTFKTYPTDHSGALLMSQDDTIPFVRRLFAPE